MKLQFFDRFSKNTRYQIEWKSVQWEPNCWRRMDGRTDRHDELNSRCSQFCQRSSELNVHRHFPSPLPNHRFSMFLIVSWYCCSIAATVRAIVGNVTSFSSGWSALTSSSSVHVQVESRAVTSFDYFPRTSENRLCLDTCCSIYKLVNVYCPWLHDPRYSVLLWVRLWLPFSCLLKRDF